MCVTLGKTYWFPNTIMMVKVKSVEFDFWWGIQGLEIKQTKTHPDFPDANRRKMGKTFKKKIVRIFLILTLNISVSSSSISFPPVLVGWSSLFHKPWRLQILVVKAPPQKNLQIMPQADTLDDLAADSSPGYSSAVEPRGTSWESCDTVDGRNPANHQGCMKPYKQWEKLPINWCRISAINSISLFQKQQISSLNFTIEMVPSSWVFPDASREWELIVKQKMFIVKSSMFIFSSKEI